MREEGTYRRKEGRKEERGGEEGGEEGGEDWWSQVVRSQYKYTMAWSSLKVKLHSTFLRALDILLDP